VNVSGFTALHAAAMHGWVSTCRLLMQLGAPADGEPDFPSPLHLAGFYGHESVVQALLLSRAEVNRRIELLSYIHLFNSAKYKLRDLGFLALSALQVSLMGENPSHPCISLLCKSGAVLYGGEVDYAVRAETLIHSIYYSIVEGIPTNRHYTQPSVIHSASESFQNG
jgi:ankyrin repeat protein